MRIEYTVSADNQIEGNGWICYYRDLYSFSAIFDTLLTLIKDSKETEFDKLKSLVKSGYQLATARSKADIYTRENDIDICKLNKTLPHIWVVKQN